MANRAYLYPTDINDPGDEATLFDIRTILDIPYADSRNSMPFAWLFFWLPEQMMLVLEWLPEVADTTFIAPRLVACDLFESRLPLLLRLVPEIADAEPMVNRLLTEIRRWDSKYLRLDTWEVWQCGQEDRDYIRPVLDAINKGDALEIRRLYPLAERVLRMQGENGHVEFIGAIYAK